MRPTNSPSEAPVAFSTLASDSVLGQRCLPSLVMRLLLLKVVGSSPAWRASPEGERLYRAARRSIRSEEHTSELQSLMRISYAVFCLKKKKKNKQHISSSKDNKSLTKILSMIAI